MARMTMGQWRERLGDAVSLDEAPRQMGMASMQVVRAVNSGKVPLHTFRAADGRVFRMVRTRDLEAYKSQPATTPKPAITMEGMKAAFKTMAESA
ncbi:MAG: hypothetical protein ACE37H_02925 [Phycisphaeraceae bacterium]